MARFVRRPPLLLVISSLYLAQGIPLGLIVEALPALLRAQGAPLETIALLPMAMIPWMVKVLWAPVVDNHWNPVLGRRRSWILPTQAVILAVLLIIAASSFAPDGSREVIALLGVASLAAATQDIAIDGLAAERLGAGQMAMANSLQIGGMMSGMLIGGAGMLILTEWWGGHAAMLTLCGLVGLAAVPSWLWREPAPNGAGRPPPARLRHFFRRDGGWALAAVMTVFAANRGIDMTLSKPFLVEQGWGLAEIGVVIASGSSAMMITGAAVAGPLVRRLGAGPMILAGIALALTGSLLWLGMAWTGAAPLAGVIAATACGSAGFGLSAVGVFTLAFHFAHARHQAGTDITIAQCLHTVGEMALVPPATYLAAHLGFAGGFALSLAVGLTALTIVALTRRACAPARLAEVPPPHAECA